MVLLHPSQTEGDNSLTQGRRGGGHLKATRDSDTAGSSPAVSTKIPVGTPARSQRSRQANRAVPQEASFCVTSPAACSAARRTCGEWCMVRAARSSTAALRVASGRAKRREGCCRGDRHE